MNAIMSYMVTQEYYMYDICHSAYWTCLQRLVTSLAGLINLKIRLPQVTDLVGWGHAFK